MKSLLAAVVAAALPGAVPAAAHAAATAPVPVALSYSEPQFSADGDRSTWHWTVSNTGDRDAGQVVVTHTLTPKVRITSLSRPCHIVQDGAVRCDYGTLRPGETRRGVLAAAVEPAQEGPVRIQGHVTWRDLELRS